MKKIRFVKKLRNCGNRSRYDPKKEEIKHQMQRMRNEKGE
jgi:hypothetical protein